MNTALKTVLTTVAAGVIMAVLYGTNDLIFTAYGAEAQAAQNAKDIAETKANTKEAAAKATQAAEATVRIEATQAAVLRALESIQQRLP